jgi:hypothetical protein
MGVSVPAPKGNDKSAARLIALASFGLILLLPPALVRFDHNAAVLGVPVLWAYLFLVWAVIIGLIAVLVRRSG